MQEEEEGSGKEGYNYSFTIKYFKIENAQLQMRM